MATPSKSPLVKDPSSSAALGGHGAFGAPPAPHCVAARPVAAAAAPVAAPTTPPRLLGRAGQSQRRAATRASHCHPTGTDMAIPEATTVRSKILSYLPTDDIVSASRIHQLWYHAAAAKECWQRKVAAHPDLGPLCTQHALELDSAGMYRLVLASITATEVHSYVDNILHDRAYYENCGLLFCNGGQQFTVHFPAAHLLLRHPSMNCVGSPGDVPEGCVQTPRWMHVLALVMRWCQSERSRTMLPWLLSVYRWVAVCPYAFNKIMLVPAVEILNCKAVPADHAIVMEVWELTKYLMEKFLVDDDAPPVDEGSSFHTPQRGTRGSDRSVVRSRGGGTPNSGSKQFEVVRPSGSPAPPSVHVSDTNPRLLFGIVLKLCERLYGSVEAGGAVLEECVALFGGDEGRVMDELRQARRRVEAFLLARKMAPPPPPHVVLK